MRIDLPDGDYAEVLDPDQLRSGDLKAYRAAIPADGSPITLGVLDGMKDMLLQRVVTAWSLDLPLPRDLPGTPEEAGSLDRMPLAAYKALVAGIGPHVDLIEADGPDPKSSPDSAGTSLASGSTSTPASST
jgi:hypothetical protein